MEHAYVSILPVELDFFLNFNCYIIGFVLSKHDVAKSTLIDCINDKCANARRIAKKKPKE